MKKLFILFVSGLLSLTATAQQSVLIGSWQQLDSNGFPTTNVKVFMPDGKLLGQCFNEDFTVSSVWFMSNYKVLNDTSFVDHEFYHSNISYQHDYFFTFYKENDSVLVTKYIDHRNDGVGAIMQERWKKMNSPLPVFTDAEWEALHQKSLAEFDRLPKEGQTVEQYADELLNKALGTNRLDRIIESLVIRAELDTTNLRWQQDALMGFTQNHISPSIAEKIVDRAIRLAEATAPTPSDTTVTDMYRLKALLFAYRDPTVLGTGIKIQEKLVELEDQRGVPTGVYGYDCSNLALIYNSLGDYEKGYECAAKAVNIYEQLPDVPNLQKGTAYFYQVKALANTKRLREAIDLALDKVVPLFTNEQGEVNDILTTEVYPVVYGCYHLLNEADPKDKKLIKEAEQFMSDKLLYCVFKSTDKDLNLFGEYLVLERGEWNVEDPVLNVSSTKHILLKKGDEYISLDLKDDQEFNAPPIIRPVDAATKENIIKQWKAYKKGKKVKK